MRDWLSSGGYMSVHAAAYPDLFCHAQTVEDTIPGPSGGEGHVQFSADRVVPPEALAEAKAGGWDYGSSAPSNSSSSSSSSSSGSAPAPAPTVSTPAPTAAGARATPSSEQYTAVGGRRLLATRA